MLMLVERGLDVRWWRVGIGRKQDRINMWTAQADLGERVVVMRWICLTPETDSKTFCSLVQSSAMDSILFLRKACRSHHRNNMGERFAGKISCQFQHHTRGCRHNLCIIHLYCRAMDPATLQRLLGVMEFLVSFRCRLCASLLQMYDSLICRIALT